MWCIIFSDSSLFCWIKTSSKWFISIEQIQFTDLLCKIRCRPQACAVWTVHQWIHITSSLLHVSTWSYRLRGGRTVCGPMHGRLCNHRRAHGPQPVRDTTAQNGMESDRVLLTSQGLATSPRLLLPGLAQVGIEPAAEAVLLVPAALSVADQHQFVGSHDGSYSFI